MGVKIGRRLSADGVFFSCSVCDYTPEMAGKKDDLIKMKYCPNCGVKFKNIWTPKQK